MKRIVWALILVFSFFHPTTVRPQSMYGNTLGNYSGVNAAILNPSSILNSRSYLDIQLVGADIFLENNYLYISKNDYKFSNFFKSGYEWPMHAEEYGVESRALYFYNNTNLKKAYNQQWLLGPGIMLNWGHHALALSTGVREIVSARNIPYELANFAWLGLYYPPQHNINYIDQIPMRAAGMAWAEVGLTYANTFYARGFNMLSAGITLKRLLGFSGFYVHTTELDYIIPNDSTIIVNNMDADMALSLPVNYNTNQINTDPLFKGKGFGLDLGITYKRLLNYHQDQYYTSLCAKPYEDYLYRIGVALIDFGGIRFKNNAEKLKIDNKSSVWNNVNHLPYTNIDKLLDTLSYQFYGDTTSARVDDKFFLWAPTAVSAQFDYRIDKHWYLNGSFIYGIPMFKNMIVRPAELSFTPRFETAYFEVNLPVSLYDWTRPRVGLSVRIYGVTIGTEKLGSYFHFSNFTGLDIYFSIRLFFNKGSCRLKGPVHCGEKKSWKDNL
jgi:hypothetical protein